jgi:hypothetical protein
VCGFCMRRPLHRSDAFAGLPRGDFRAQGRAWLAPENYETGIPAA